MSETEASSSGDISLPVENAPEGSRFGRAHHILLIFLGVAAVIWLLSGIYQVNNDEVAIVERLGTYVSGGDGKAILVERGLHYSLPWPIDRIHRISTKLQRTLSVTWFNEPPDSYKDWKSDYLRRGVPQEVLSSIFDPYLITGDLNVIHMGLGVQYRIDDPEAWLTMVAHSEEDSDNVAGKREELFQEVAKHAMTSRLGAMSVDEVLFTGQAELPTTLYEAMAKAMRLENPVETTGVGTSGLGIHVESVQLLGVRPPDNVKDKFDAVGRAIQLARMARDQAQGKADAAHTEAIAQQTTLTRDAEAYRNKVVGAAKGEAARFSQVLAQYEKAPDLTLWNVYVDAIKPITSGANRIIFAQPGQRTYIVLDPPEFDARQVGPPGHGP
jgi:membrane protease subunit HflK